MSKGNAAFPWQRSDILERRKPLKVSLLSFSYFYRERRGNSWRCFNSPIQVARLPMKADHTESTSTSKEYWHFLQVTLDYLFLALLLSFACM